MRHRRHLIGLSVVIALLVIVLCAPVCSASSLDGIYDYTYTLYGPNGWETRHVDSGFCVSGGVISSNPPALSGAVDAGGGVRFAGPCPYGDPQATFTGRLTPDGQGSGQYQCPHGHSGTWSVIRVSGAGGGFIDGVPTVVDRAFDFLAGIGGVLALSDDEFINAAVGGVILIVALVCLVLILRSVAAASRRRHSASGRGAGGAAPGPAAIIGGVLAVIAGFLDMLFAILVVLSGAVLETLGTGSLDLGGEPFGGGAGVLAWVAAFAFLIGILAMVGGILARRRPAVGIVLMLLAAGGNFMAGTPGVVVGLALVLSALLVLAGRRAARLLSEGAGPATPHR